MSQSHIRLTYDGPALAAHSMDVRLLSPALLAFGDLCEDAGKALFGPDVLTKVEVKASFRAGSFGVDLSLGQQFLQQVMSLLSGNGATAAANAWTLLGALGMTGGGLIGALRWLKNRRIKRIEPTPGGRRIITEDDDALEVEESVIILLRSRTVRTHLQNVIAPIERDGVDTVAFGSETEFYATIERDEASAFSVPPVEDSVFREETRSIPFSIVSLSFKGDNKWRLFDGQNTVYVTMADEEFLSRVNRNQVRFAKGDVLIAETHIVYWQSSDGIRSDYTILRVAEHRPGMAQIPLPN